MLNRPDSRKKPRSMSPPTRSRKKGYSRSKSDYESGPFSPPVQRKRRKKSKTLNLDSWDKNRSQSTNYKQKMSNLNSLGFQESFEPIEDNLQNRVFSFIKPQPLSGRENSSPQKNQPLLEVTQGDLLNAIQKLIGDNLSHNIFDSPNKRTSKEINKSQGQGQGNKQSLESLPDQKSKQFRLLRQRGKKKSVKRNVGDLSRKRNGN